MTITERDVQLYLNPDEFKNVCSWADPYLPYLKQYPLLQQVDLVIEGGIGTSISLNIVHRLFPQAVYIGTDLSPRIVGRRPRQINQIDDQILNGILEVDGTFGQKNYENAVIHANCFDTKLIRDIMKKTGRYTPLLFSIDALNALLDMQKMNPWDKKFDVDKYTTQQVITSTSPYVAQLHIAIDVWKEPQGHRHHYELETAADKNNHWTTIRAEDALILLRK